MIVKKYIIDLMLAACIVGCNGRDRDSQKDSNKPGSPVTREQARKILWDLPEVAKWSNEVRNTLFSKVVPVCDVERTPTDFASAGEKPAWIFKFAESRRDRTIFWQRFRVDAVSGDVSVWDQFKGTYVPLAEWRNKFHPR